MEVQLFVSFQPFNGMVWVKDTLIANKLKTILFCFM